MAFMQQRLQMQQQQQNLLAQQLLEQQKHSLRRIYVGSINYQLTDADIRQAFSCFGPILEVNMSIDPSTGRHKGFCFVEYASEESAKMALESLNGITLGGRQLKVGRPNRGNQPAIPTMPMMGLSNPLMMGATNPAQLSSPAAAGATTTSSPASGTSPAAATSSTGATTSAAIPDPTEAMRKLQEAAAIANAKVGLVGEGANSALQVGSTAPINPDCRIYVGSIPWELTAKDLEMVFQSFGTVTSVSLPVS